MAKNKWGDWQIVDEIDGGGQGTVYKVQDSNARLGWCNTFFGVLGFMNYRSDRTPSPVVPTTQQ